MAYKLKHGIYTTFKLVGCPRKMTSECSQVSLLWVVVAQLSAGHPKGGPAERPEGLLQKDVAVSPLLDTEQRKPHTTNT